MSTADKVIDTLAADLVRLRADCARLTTSANHIDVQIAEARHLQASLRAGLILMLDDLDRMDKVIAKLRGPAPPKA